MTATGFEEPYESHWHLATEQPSSASPDRSGPPATATTTLRSRHCGQHSSVISTGSMASRPGDHEVCSARRSSITSKASTTLSARRSVSDTVHLPTLNQRSSL